MDKTVGRKSFRIETGNEIQGEAQKCLKDLIKDKFEITN